MHSLANSKDPDEMLHNANILRNSIILTKEDSFDIAILCNFQNLQGLGFRV